MLHTLTHSPFHIDVNALLRVVSCDDVLLLCSDGVTAGLKDNLFLTQLRDTGISVVYALTEDIEARGLANLIGDEIELIDYPSFVELTVCHYPQIVW